MTADAARDALAGAVADGSRALGNFAVRGPALDQARVSRFDLTEALAGQVADDVAHSVGQVAQKEFLAYDPSYQTSQSQVLVERLDLVPELAVVDATVRAGDVADDSDNTDDVDDVDDTDGNPVVAMAHALGIGDRQVVAYRVKGPGIATRRPRGIPLIPRGGIYRPLDGEILYYEPRFDAYTCSGFVYFSTVTLIQTKLHADDKARQLAKQTLSAVTAKVTIDGYDGLERAVMDDPALRAKMSSVARLLQTDPAYAEALTTRNLVRFVEDHPQYDIPVAVVDRRKALRFDPSPQHRHQIPRLLADDYLHSYLTDRSYEAGSKQRVQGP
jgi:hypothetical protein